MIRVGLAVVVAVTPTFLLAQSAVSTRGELTLKAGTQEVLLDFIARDKHQKLITDLRADEVNIYEDSVLQRLTSFVYRTGAGSQESKPAKPAPIQDRLREINLVSIVFEGMSADTRRRATQFANEFLDTELGPNTWLGVFTLNRQLSVIQPYTTELPLVRDAVARAGTGSYQLFAKESLDRLKRINSLAAMGKGPADGSLGRFQPFAIGTAEERGPAGGLGSAAAFELQLQQLVLKGLYEQNGLRTVDALRNLIRSQQLLPGRKTVLYISEGLVVPPEQPELLRSVMGEANRGNVTFYTLDARGLDTTSGMTAARSANSAINQADRSSDPAVLHTNLEQNARELAEGTGGFAMDSSNDLRGLLRRLMEDVRAHYEVTYVPKSNNLDGHFRSTEVRVLRTGLKVQSRKGYFAVPIADGEPLSLVEVSALRALETSPPPRAVEFQAAALRFGTGPEGTEYRLVFSTPARAISFRDDPASKTFQVHVTGLALIKNVEGQSQTVSAVPNAAAVSRVSRDLPYRAPLSRRADFENGEITLVMPLVLQPGRYRLETVMLDVEGAKASVRKLSLAVPGSLTAGHFDVSDFIWVRSVAKVAVSATPDPLDTADGRVTPELNPAFPADSTPSFVFHVYGLNQGSSSPTARLTLSKDGTTVKRADLTLPAATSDGSILFAGQLPLRNLPAGEYDASVTVQAGGMEISRPTHFSIH